MINWAVTGATGFVGFALLQRCAALNLVTRRGVQSGDVLGITRSAFFKGLPGVRYVHVGDLSKPIHWHPLLSGVDVMVHTAARVHVMVDTVKDPLAMFRVVNVKATSCLALQAASAGVKRFIFISSIGVNGCETNANTAFTERYSVNTHNDYTLSKYEAEQCLRQIALDTGLEVVIIRPPLVYGGSAPGNFGALMRAVQRGIPLPLGAVHNQRSLVALDNLVDFIITCATHPKAANQTFLVSDGQDLSTTELIQGMAKAAGVSSRLFPVPVWALEAGASLLGKKDMVQRLCGNLQVDITKARTLLGWTPPITVEEGLRRAFAGSPSVK